MQQTEKYKLNLIEAGDPFSPTPLNVNAQATEDGLAALDGRVAVLEAKKLVIGSFTGNGSTQTIELGFTPFFVLVYNFNVGSNHAFATPDRAASGTDNGYHRDCLRVVEGGFFIRLASSMNTSGTSYNYLAIG